MALAYTAPTWTDGSGEGISASNLQAISNCIEGLVQGSDKAIHSVSISGSVITVTYADGTQETGNITNLKGIVSVTKTSSSGLVDTYTILYTDGTTDTFTITNGSASGDMLEADYDPSETVKDAGGITAYVSSAISGKANSSDLDGWTTAATVSSGTVTFTGLDDSLAYDLYCERPNVTVSSIAQTGSGTSMQLVYTLSGATDGDSCKLRILK